jgi:predicted metalloprotease with PDZ domain
MKRFTWFLVLLAVAALPALAFAGGGGKCGENVSACLTHWSAMKTSGWLGMKYDKAEDGTVTVTKVMAGSPAETAGFKKGDVLVALNGASLADKEALKKAKGAWKPGDKVTYTVKRAGAESQIAVTLAPMPEELFAQMLGEHVAANHMPAADAAAASAGK